MLRLDERLIHSAVIGAAVVAGVLSACGSPPPDEISDAEAALIYGEVLGRARRALRLTAAVPVHPYIAVMQDSLGYPKAQLEEFEFARSAPLSNLEHSDSSVVFCEYNAQGVCASPAYLVLSQIKRTMERDASVVVLAVNNTDNTDTPALRYLRVELRYTGDRWRIVDTQVAR